jgi:hypothetical protein
MCEHLVLVGLPWLAGMAGLRLAGNSPGCELHRVPAFAAPGQPAAAPPPQLGVTFRRRGSQTG